MGARRPWSGLVLQAGDLRPLRDRPLPLRDSDPVNTVGEPYSGKPNVRFDEGRLGRAGPKPAAYSTTSGAGSVEVMPLPRFNRSGTVGLMPLPPFPGPSVRNWSTAGSRGR